MLGFFSIPKDGSDIHRFFKHEVGPSHVYCWKSMGIGGIIKQTRKIPRYVSYLNIFKLLFIQNLILDLR